VSSPGVIPLLEKVTLRSKQKRAGALINGRKILTGAAWLYVNCMLVVPTLGCEKHRHRFLSDHDDHKDRTPSAPFIIGRSSFQAKLLSLTVAAAVAPKIQPLPSKAS